MDRVVTAAAAAGCWRLLTQPSSQTTHLSSTP